MKFPTDSGQWESGVNSDSVETHRWLTERVARIHAEVKARYGSPRMHAEVADRGHDCCVNAVARVVREAGIAAKSK